MRSDADRTRLAQQIGAAPREDGTTHKGKFDIGLVRGACDLIDSSGVLEEAARWRALEPRGRGGRPASYADSDRLVLVLMLILLLTGGSPQIAEMARTIETRLEADSREYLGLPPSNGRASTRALYDRVRRAFKRFTVLCDPLPGMTHVRLTRAETEAIQEARNTVPGAAADKETKIRRAHWVMNTLLQASLDLLPPETLAEWQGDTSCDATPLPVWGKAGQPQRRRTPTDKMSPEFEAAWYHLPDDVLIWAYALHITITAPNPFNPGRHPVLAVAASLDIPNKRAGANAVAMHQSIRDRGFPTGYADTDRGYFSHATGAAYNRPMKALGYAVVGDYKQTQLGIQASARGAIAVEGWTYCPSMPQELIDATKTFNIDGDRATYDMRLEQRRKHAFRPKDSTGNVLMCPAQGPGATASCTARPNGPVNLGLPTHRDFAAVLDPPEHLPACCTNSTSVTLPDDFNEKFAQTLQFGTEEWRSVHKPLRSIMEGYNGYTKDTANEGLGLAANRRVRGFFANALVAAMTMAASNIRKIHAWHLAGCPPAMKPKPRPRRGGSANGAVPVVEARPEPGWYSDPPDEKRLPAAS